MQCNPLLVYPIIIVYQERLINAYQCFLHTLYFKNIIKCIETFPVAMWCTVTVLQSHSLGDQCFFLSWCNMTNHELLYRKGHVPEKCTVACSCLFLHDLRHISSWQYHIAQEGCTWLWGDPRDSLSCDMAVSCGRSKSSPCHQDRSE